MLSCGWMLSLYCFLLWWFAINAAIAVIAAIRADIAATSRESSCIWVEINSKNGLLSILNSLLKYSAKDLSRLGRTKFVRWSCCANSHPRGGIRSVISSQSRCKMAAHLSSSDAFLMYRPLLIRASAGFFASSGIAHTKPTCIAPGIRSSLQRIWTLRADTPHFSAVCAADKYFIVFSSKAWSACTYNYSYYIVLWNANKINSFRQSSKRISKFKSFGIPQKKKWAYRLQGWNAHFSGVYGHRMCLLFSKISYPIASCAPVFEKAGAHFLKEGVKFSGKSVR